MYGVVESEEQHGDVSEEKLLQRGSFTVYTCNTTASC
jgi:hypothetical protein